MLLAARLVRGQPAAKTELGSPSVVDVTVLGTPDDLERIRSSIGRSDFDGAETRWRQRVRWDASEVLRSEADPTIRVRCWIDVSKRGRARLYFANAARERFLLRDVPLPDGLSDLGRESIAQVLEMSVTALVEEGEAGMSRSETQQLLAEDDARKSPEGSTRQPEPEVNAPSAIAPSDSSFELRAFYAVRLYSDEVSIVHGPGLAFASLAGDTVTRAFSVSLAYEFARERAAAEVGLEWQTVALRGSFEISRRLGQGQARLFGRLGAGVDLTHFIPRRTTDNPALAVTSERSSLEPALTPALGASTLLFDGFGAFAQVSADFYPARTYYDLETDGGTSRVFVPWRLRPGVALGLLLR